MFRLQSSDVADYAEGEEEAHVGEAEQRPEEDLGPPEKAKSARADFDLDRVWETCMGGIEILARTQRTQAYGHRGFAKVPFLQSRPSLNLPVRVAKLQITYQEFFILRVRTVT